LSRGHARPNFSNMVDYEILGGGTLTSGIVRIGDTVRRPANGDRSFQHRLLGHLEKIGFAAAPRFLGVDDQRRDILEFIVGRAGADGDHYSDVQLAAAAALLRRFHDATSGLPLCAPHEVVCHNDWSPANTVFREGMPVAMIDFDMAAPGARLWDLAYSAMSWLNLASPEPPPQEQLRRLSVMLDSYGQGAMSDLAAQLTARSAAVAAWAQRTDRPDDLRWATSCMNWALANLAHTTPPAGERPHQV
jgi:Phosphotransferase enzyme family